MNRTKIWTDGSGSVACYVVEGHSPVIVENLPGMTHNESEYWAIYLALKHVALESGYRVVEIISDSQLAINQLNGYYKIREPRLAKYVSKIRALEAALDIVYTWEPREENEAGKVLE